MVAAAILHAAERDALPSKRYQPALQLVWRALWKSLAALEAEAVASESLIGPTSTLADGVVYGARAMITLGWVATARLLRARYAEAVRAAGAPEGPGAEAAVALVVREWPGARITGEVDWPYVLALGLYLERARHAGECEALCELWVRRVVEANRGRKPPGIAPPYWLHERVLRRAYGMLAPNESEERFADHTYTALSALDMLVRRLRRQLVASLWPAVTHLDACDFIPPTAADWFLWRAPRGDLRTGHLEPTASWSAWRAGSGEVDAAALPPTLVRHAEWVLPFALTYPHRANRLLCAYADAVIGQRARLVDRASA